jgi:hypothetical protein
MYFVNAEVKDIVEKPYGQFPELIECQFFFRYLFQLC